MAYQVLDKLEMGTREMRAVLADTLGELIAKNSKVVALDADMLSSSGLKPLYQKDPVHVVQSGIQEANMVGVACGMSFVGLVPYVHAFACFITRRVFDQVFLSAGYAGANVRFIGSDPGITAAYNGGTHMPFEDVGIMRMVPGMTIVEATDAVMLEDILRQTETAQGNFYIRMPRKLMYNIFQPGSTFRLGQACKLRAGTDVTLVASGICVGEALLAADLLAQEGISAAVLNPFTIKPLDREAIVEAAKNTGAIVTAENHNIINGLGSAVAEVLAEECPTPMLRVGVRDEFGEVGTVEYLRQRFGIGAPNIAQAARDVIKRK